MVKLDELRQQLGDDRDCIDRLILKINDTTIGANILLDCLEQAFGDYKQTFKEALKACKQDQRQRAQIQQLYDDTVTEYLRAKQIILDKIMTSTPAPVPPPSGVPDIQLPPLTLPSFSGDVKQWLSFSDLFTVSVINNSRLSDAQRLQHLKASLKDEAADLLSHLCITNSNFRDAWSLLESRYEDKRELVRQHLANLLDQPEVTASSDLRRFIDKCNGALRALATLKVNKFDVVMEYLTLKKVPQELRREWELSLSPKTIPSLADLLDFIERRAKAESSTSAAGQPRDGQKKATQNNSAPSGSNKPKPTRCAFCTKDHSTYFCQGFKSANPLQRSTTIKENGFCTNCLGQHLVDACKSPGRCKTCSRQHHSLLHFSGTAETPKTLHIAQEKATVLLSTAIVKLQSDKKTMVARALVDTGSTVDVVTEHVMNGLLAKPNPSATNIQGLQGSDIGGTRGTISLTIGSMYGPASSHKSTAYVVRNITSPKPSQEVSVGQLDHIKGLQLADPLFHQPGDIDILIGVETYNSLRGTAAEGRRGPPGTPFAEKTDLGWLISGPCPSAPSGSTSEGDFPTTLTLEESIERFWSLEKVPEKGHLTPEEESCEKFFMETVQRLDSGRFQVGLPLKGSPPSNTRPLALIRLLSLEKRISRQPEFGSLYKEVMNDYIAQGHLVPVPQSEINNYAVYLPHHGVLKPSSTTTKLRVVYDASASSFGMPSLNDCLMNGPRTQEDLPVILTRFRRHKYAFTADIRQMYRQVSIREEDRDFQRILWRLSPSGPISEYRLTTVTFGVKTAPFLATKTLNVLADLEAAKFPEASQVVRKDIYVDNVLTGSDNFDKATKLIKDVTCLLTAGGFHLREFASNSPLLLASVPEDDVHQVEHTFVDTEIKTLGISWSPHRDVFNIAISTFPTRKLTKRTMLAETASIFDPLGWIAPVTVSAKVLMQRLWTTECGWDDIVPNHIKGQWEMIKSELPLLTELNIPRHVPVKDNTELVGFSDASETAYAACIYAKTRLGDRTIVRLIAAKTKVAPLKAISLPRLELSAALLLARLAKPTMDNLQVNKFIAYSDSTVALAWIASQPSRWKTFERNRVAEIQESIPPEHWHYVRSEDNPADVASRGASPSVLANHLLWWQGPPWLKEETPDFLRPEPEQLDIEAAVRNQTILLTTQHDDDFTQRFSSWGRLVRVTAYMLRFLHRSGQQGPITATEHRTATKSIIRFIQGWYFHDELHCIKNGKSLQATSKLLCLMPFLDSDGILRIGGRLKNSRLPVAAKHQILLPKESHICTLLWRSAHAETLHGGPTAMLAYFQLRYWTTSSLNRAKQVARACTVCRRHRAAAPIQIMADLPAKRVTPSRPFTHTGVDYTGSVSLRAILARGSRAYKGYIAVFVCFATKAVHLEAVSSLSTEAFIAALRRFIGRRGKPVSISSDNGSNFVGADKELASYLKDLPADPEIASFLAAQEITWSFIPPRAPHHGGLWEAAVKSAKRLLSRIIGDRPMNFEELATILVQIEAALNSRPLTAISQDITSLEALTAGHFLIGSSLLSAPDFDVTDTQQNRLTRFQLVQQVVQQFWKQWSTEYLQSLNRRAKWLKPQANMKVGDLVLLKNVDSPPLHWPLARITATHPGQDGNVRVVTVTTSAASYRRPIGELVPLFD